MQVLSLCIKPLSTALSSFFIVKYIVTFPLLGDGQTSANKVGGGNNCLVVIRIKLCHYLLTQRIWYCRILNICMPFIVTSLFFTEEMQTWTLCYRARKKHQHWLRHLHITNTTSFHNLLKCYVWKLQIKGQPVRVLQYCVCNSRILCWWLYISRVYLWII